MAVKACLYYCQAKQRTRPRSAGSLCAWGSSPPPDQPQPSPVNHPGRAIITQPRSNPIRSMAFFHRYGIHARSPTQPPLHVNAIPQVPSIIDVSTAVLPAVHTVARSPRVACPMLAQASPRHSAWPHPYWRPPHGALRGPQTSHHVPCGRAVWCDQHWRALFTRFWDHPPEHGGTRSLEGWAATRVTTLAEW